MSRGTAQRGGPLRGLRVVELGALGPVPFAGMLLADMGADVVLVERPGGAPGAGAAAGQAVLERGRRRVRLDLKRAADVQKALRLVECTDVLLEGFRPGVMERLGLGPDICCARNPQLVYGRMTGWGRDGPLAHTAGHDIDYTALSGALHAVGPMDGAPVPPLNLVGDYGGGGMLLAFGVLAASWEAQRSGRGQVVDAAMVDGASLLMTLFHGMRQMGLWQERRASNLLDGGAPFYSVYETSDGEHMAVGALEPQFYARLLEGLELNPEALPAQWDRAQWPKLRTRLAEVFRTRTRAAWSRIFEGTDACVSPVLRMHESTEHPHMRARDAYVDIDGIRQPAPAPRFSRTAPEPPRPPREECVEDVLEAWGE